MKLYFIIILTFTYSICLGQNLVSNGDFENYSSCPPYCMSTDLNLATPWFIPTLGTSDYYNQCAADTSCYGVPINCCGNFQHAHSGGGYAGIFLMPGTPYNGREYLEAPLTSPLIANGCYHFEMFVNLYNISEYTSDDIGVYFSDTAINASYYTALSFTPEISNTSGNFFDTLNWTLVSGDFDAHGGENYLIIGNFLNDAMTTKISVNTNGNPYIYCLIDDVSLVSNGCNLGISNFQAANLSPYPNPFISNLTFNCECNKPYDLSFYDFQGRTILKQRFINSFTFNTEEIEKGIYFYVVQDQFGIIKTGKVVK